MRTTISVQRRMHTVSNPEQWPQSCTRPSEMNGARRFYPGSLPSFSVLREGWWPLYLKFCISLIQEITSIKEKLESFEKWGLWQPHSRIIVSRDWTSSETVACEQAHLFGYREPAKRWKVCVQTSEPARRLVRQINLATTNAVDKPPFTPDYR